VLRVALCVSQLPGITPINLFPSTYEAYLDQMDILNECHIVSFMGAIYKETEISPYFQISYYCNCITETVICFFMAFTFMDSI